MLVTLRELQSRIETVRRHIGDRSGMAVLRVRINGHWIDATREAFVVDDSGAIIIDASLPQVCPTCGEV